VIALREPEGLTSDEIARILRARPDLVAAANREIIRNKGYQLFPMGQEAEAYLRVKRKRLTDLSRRDWESSLDKFARFFPDAQSLTEFEPPAGTNRIEEYLDSMWGDAAPSTYNKHLSIIRDFFKFQIIRGNMHGDPTLPIEVAKKRGVYRTTFSGDQRRAIVAEAEELRDRIALRLLLDYGLRRGAVMVVQFKHFDHQRRTLTIFTKGSKVRNVPIPHPEFWMDLERHILDVEAQASHYLMPRNNGNQKKRLLDPTKPIGGHGIHTWWYRRLAAAGIVSEGVESGERIHKARHTAGQRVLDATGNLKAVQALLGHASIQTTGDIYVDHDLNQLTATMTQVLLEDQD
jgi:integrase/recombinase XerC